MVQTQCENAAWAGGHFFKKPIDTASTSGPWKGLGLARCE